MKKVIDSKDIHIQEKLQRLSRSNIAAMVIFESICFNLVSAKYLRLGSFKKVSKD